MSKAAARAAETAGGRSRFLGFDFATVSVQACSRMQEVKSSLVLTATEPTSTAVFAILRGQQVSGFFGLAAERFAGHWAIAANEIRG